MLIVILFSVSSYSSVTIHSYVPSSHTASYIPYFTNRCTPSMYIQVSYLLVSPHSPRSMTVLALLTVLPCNTMYIHQYSQLGQLLVINTTVFLSHHIECHMAP